MLSDSDRGSTLFGRTYLRDYISHFMHELQAPLIKNYKKIKLLSLTLCLQRCWLIKKKEKVPKGVLCSIYDGLKISYSLSYKLCYWVFDWLWTNPWSAKACFYRRWRRGTSSASYVLWRFMRDLINWRCALRIYKAETLQILSQEQGWRMV